MPACAACSRLNMQVFHHYQSLFIAGAASFYNQHDISASFSLFALTLNPLPVIPHILQDMQEGAAAAIDRARTLLQQDDLLSRSSLDGPPPLLPMLPNHVYSNDRNDSSPRTRAVSNAGTGAHGNGRPSVGEVGGVEDQRRQPLQGEGAGARRIKGGGERASVVMEDGSELSVDPRTGRVLTGGGLELL